LIFKKEHRWNDEKFLRRACDEMARELDWDSLDSGCLHHAVSSAKTLDGRHVIIAVVNSVNNWEEVLDDAAAERQHAAQPTSAPLWIYVPGDFDVPEEIARKVVLRHVPHYVRA